jgi:hypothetical protein
MAEPTSRPQQCPTCGATNRPQVTWCIECGEPLDLPVAPERAGRPGAALSPVRMAAPDRATARRLRWEYLVGVGLLLAVLLAGGVDWLIQENGDRFYRAGVIAADARRWEEARAAFQAAGPYRDAPRRAAEAAANVQQLETAYARGVAAAAAQDWDTAVAAYTTVAGLQPDYGGVAERLPAAEAARAQQGAAGVIYQVGGAGGGLFVVGPPGTPPQRLPGSTGGSRVRLFPAPGRYVVYDIPDPHKRAPPPGFETDEQRVLLLADLADPAAPRSYALPAAFTLEGRGRPAAGGFWWFQPLPYDTTPPVFYYDYATHTAIPLPWRDGWEVVATDPARDWLVRAHQENPGTPQVRTWLYLINAQGTMHELATVVKGTVQAAQISPDGLHLLFVNVQRGLSRIEQHLTLVRLGVRERRPDPFGRARASVLETLIVPVASPQSGGRLQARFLSGQPLRILSDLTDQQGRRQTLYDLDTGIRTTFGGSLPPPFMRETFAVSPAGRFVVTQHLDPEGFRLVVQPVERLTEQQELLVRNPPDGWAVTAFSPDEDYLLYTTTVLPRGRAKQPYAVYGAALAADGRPGPPRLFYRGYYERAAVPSPALIPASGGRTLLYITSEGVLRVAALDGHFDSPFAAQVRRLWAPTP